MNWCGYSEYDRYDIILGNTYSKLRFSIFFCTIYISLPEDITIRHYIFTLRNCSKGLRTALLQWIQNRWRSTRCTTNPVLPTALFTAEDSPTASQRSLCRRLSRHSAASRKFESSRIKDMHLSGNVREIVSIISNNFSP